MTNFQFQEESALDYLATKSRMKKSRMKIENWLLKICHLLFLCLALPARGQLTNALVTVTNAPTNGASISINGNTRTWTNNVTDITTQLPLSTILAVVFTNSATNGQTIVVNGNVWMFTNVYILPGGRQSPLMTNQAAAGTNSASSATNFLAAYTANPSPFTTIAWAAGTSNTVNIYSYFGVPLTVTNSPGVPGSQPGGFSSIVATNDLGVQTTNLYNAYGQYLIPSTMNVFQGPATNQVQFLSFPGSTLTVTFPANGWASVGYTAYAPTNFVPVVVPDGGLPVTTLTGWQRTNQESGLVALLSDNKATNVVDKSSPIWTQFGSQNAGIPNVLAQNLNLNTILLSNIVQRIQARTSPPVRVLFMGDSMSAASFEGFNSSATWMAQDLPNAYDQTWPPFCEQWLNYNCVPTPPYVSFFTNWWAGVPWAMYGGTYVNFQTFTNVNQLEFAWFQQPLGNATLSIYTNSVLMANVQGYAAAFTSAYQKFPVPLGNYTCAFLSASSSYTNIALGATGVNTNAPGYEFFFTSHGNTTLTNTNPSYSGAMLTCASNTLYNIYSGIQPDLVIYHAKDYDECSTGAGQIASWLAMHNQLTNAITNAVWAIVGTPDQAGSDDNGVLQNNLYRALCQTNPSVAYVSANIPLAYYTNGLSLDGTHPTAAGGRLIGRMAETGLGLKNVNQALLEVESGSFSAGLTTSSNVPGTPFALIVQNSRPQAIGGRILISPTNDQSTGLIFGMITNDGTWHGWDAFMQVNTASNINFTVWEMLAGNIPGYGNGPLFQFDHDMNVYGTFGAAGKANFAGDVNFFSGNKFQVGGTNAAAGQVLTATDSSGHAAFAPGAQLLNWHRMPADWNISTDGTNYWICRGDYAQSFFTNDLAAGLQYIENLGGPLSGTWHFATTPATNSNPMYNRSPYIISNTVIITNDIVMSGEGDRGTIIAPPPGGNNMLFQFGTATVAIPTICRIEDIRWEGQISGANSFCLNFSNCVEPFIKNCEFHDFTGCAVTIGNVSTQSTLWAGSLDTWYIVPANANAVGLAITSTDINDQSEFKVLGGKFQSLGGLCIVISNNFRRVDIQAVTFQGNDSLTPASPITNPIIQIYGGQHILFQGNHIYDWGMTNSQNTGLIVFNDTGSPYNANALIEGNFNDLSIPYFTSPGNMVTNWAQVPADISGVNAYNNQIYGRLDSMPATNYSYSPITNGSAGVALAYNTYYTNTFGRKAKVYFTSANSTAASYQVEIFVFNTNQPFVAPPIYVTQPNLSIGTNTTVFDLGAWDYFGMTNTIGTATIVTNFCQY